MAENDEDKPGLLGGLGKLIRGAAGGLPGYRTSKATLREATRDADSLRHGENPLETPDVHLQDLERLAPHVGDGDRERFDRLRSDLVQRAMAVIERRAGLTNDREQDERSNTAAEAMTEIEDQGAEEREALDLIADDRIGEGLDKLMERLTPNNAALAAQWRRIGEIAYPVDTARALRAYQTVWTLDRSDAWDGIYLARLHVRDGCLAAAAGPLDDVTKILPSEEARLRGILCNERGNILAAQGDAAGALANYRAGLSIAEDLADKEPRDSSLQRDLSVSHNSIGDMLAAQEDNEGALESYRAGLSIAQDLVAKKPTNMDWQRDLSVWHNKIGNMLAKRGDRDGALESYRAGLEIAQGLAAKNPRDTEWQRNLSISQSKIGDILAVQGDHDGALNSYHLSLKIFQDHAAKDPRNAEWQRDLGVSMWRLGKFPGSGVTWEDVANHLRGMQENGILAPVDAPYVEEAERRAEAEAAAAIN